MKRVSWLVPVILLLCVGARAQETPACEINGGYSYLRANLNGPGGSFDLNGGNVSVTENLKHWFGGRIEFNAFNGGVGGANVQRRPFLFNPCERQLPHFRITTPHFCAMYSRTTMLYLALSRGPTFGHQALKES